MTHILLIRVSRAGSGLTSLGAAAGRPAGLPMNDQEEVMREQDAAVGFQKQAQSQLQEAYLLLLAAVSQILIDEYKMKNIKGNTSTIKKTTLLLLLLH